MAAETELKGQIQRIATLVEQLESCADASVRAQVRELLESVMAMHGAGLERMLELAASAGERGEQLIEKFGNDELVSSLLLLYGLHPDDLRTRIEKAMEKSKSFLESHGA